MREHRALYPERLPPRDLIAARQRHARDLLRVSPREHHPGRRGLLAATGRALTVVAGLLAKTPASPHATSDHARPRHVVHVLIANDASGLDAPPAIAGMEHDPHGAVET